MDGFLVIWWETALYVSAVALLAAITARHRWPDLARRFDYLFVAAYCATFPPLLALHYWRTLAIAGAAGLAGAGVSVWMRRKRAAR